jgi:hypothetical protein
VSAGKSCSSYHPSSANASDSASRNFNKPCADYHRKRGSAYATPYATYRWKNGSGYAKHGDVLPLRSGNVYLRTCGIDTRLGRSV